MAMPPIQSGIYYWAPYVVNGQGYAGRVSDPKGQGNL